MILVDDEFHITYFLVYMLLKTTFINNMTN
jgi:hypothetical protein